MKSHIKTFLFTILHIQRWKNVKIHQVNPSYVEWILREIDGNKYITQMKANKKLKDMNNCGLKSGI